jgi:hypothetical protein
MRCIVLATVASAFVFTACGGPQIPAHNGYKSEKVKPWKNAKRLNFDDKGETKTDGDLSYPEQRRAKWYQFDLPAPGELTIKLEITPPGDSVNEDFDMAMEILDPGNRVISKADSEEEDVGELAKSRTLYDLPAGKYLLHLYLQGRMDSGEFQVRAAYKRTGATEYKSDFPVQVAFVPPLPTVPVVDDTPKTYKPPGPVVVKKTPRGGGTRPPPPEKKPEGPPATAKTARIVNISVSGSNSNITIGIGTDHGVQAGWKGKIQGVSSTFAVGACNPRTCSATVAATPDQIKAGGSSVTLSP